MRYFMAVMGVIIVLTFLLAIFAGTVQAGEAVPVPAGDAKPADCTPLVCLVLVVGTALLAGAVWLGTLRRVPAQPPIE